MATGFRVYNADGSLQFDMTNRLFRVLTVLDTGAVNGSTSVTAQGTIGVAVQPNDPLKVQPNVSVSGGTVSWTFPAGTKDNSRLLILEY